MKTLKLSLAFAFCFVFNSVRGAPGLTLDEFILSSGIPVYQVDVLKELPHNSKSFTQGLLDYQGMLYESTGLYGSSTVQVLSPETGETLRSVPLDGSLFGEGLSVCDGKLIQITWQEKMALVYNPDDLSQIGSWHYTTDGWGLTTDGKRMIMTDGTAHLFFRSPVDFSLDSKIDVTLKGQPIQGLNELEYFNNRVYANVLGDDFILEIDPSTGNVTAGIDARSLRSLIPDVSPPNPLNGIAYEPVSGDVFLTGKLWPTLFRCRIVRNLGER